MKKTVAKVFGMLLILAGLLGFVGNPIVSSKGFFITDTLHNLVHILLGAVLLKGAKKQPNRVMKIVAVIFLLLAIFGFVIGERKFLGIFTINSADNWLYLILSAILFGASVPDNASSGPYIPLK